MCCVKKKLVSEVYLWVVIGLKLLKYIRERLLCKQFATYAIVSQNFFQSVCFRIEQIFWLVHCCSIFTWVLGKHLFSRMLR